MNQSTVELQYDEEAGEGGLGLLDIAIALAENLRWLVLVPLLASLATLGIAFLMPPTYTARASFLPPAQQQGSAAAAALASLGGMAGLGSVTGLRNPADQLIALMQSETLQDRLIDQFKLMELYEVELRRDARRKLGGNTRLSVGKRDGLVVIEVDDRSQQRAAEIANRYIEELRRLLSTLALTEAQQRRAFFDVQLKRTRDDLTKAQQALQTSGFSPGALRAEPKAAAEEYARVKAEVSAAEVRLQVTRGRFTEASSEVQQGLSSLFALREQLAKLEKSSQAAPDSDYIGRFREFKYQETLFDLFSRQYELARLDESREGAPIQVVDKAQPPEWKSRPARLRMALMALAFTALVLVAAIVVRLLWQRGERSPRTAAKLQRLRTALRRR